MAERNVTRGYGLLERLLAKKRARMANRLIPPSFRSGRLLDLGCGVHPYFLLNTDFKEKCGLDHSVEKVEGHDELTLAPYDLHRGTALPFRDDHFDVVTMLAVFEHIDPEKLVGIVSEVRRVLKPGGLYILTTPAGWTDKLLGTLARLKVVSAAEIEDHKDTYGHEKIRSILIKANFKESNITWGYFEMFMNLWTRALKEGRTA